MAYLLIEDFKLGLDRRKARVAGVPGSLWNLTNGHITRGGEIEGAKKFVSTYILPAGTFGLTALDNNVYVFGSGADPGVPAGVTYARLRHPDESTAMTKILDVQANDGKLYVIAKYADGKIFHFYDGSLVADWWAGIVRSDMANHTGVAQHLAGLFAGDADYTGTFTGSLISITGRSNVAFTATGTTFNGGAVADQGITVATTQQAVAAVAEVVAVCSFRVMGGSANAGVNKISNIQINSVSIIAAAVDWTTSNAITAANVASAINSHTSSPDYSASAAGDTVTISAAAGSGTSPNGFVLSITTAGNVVVSNGSFRITGGTASPGVNRITSITVNGVEVLGSAVDWTTSHSATAELVAGTITSYTSSPEYGAISSGDTVLIGPTANLSSAGTLTLTVTVAGNVTTGSVVNVSPTAVPMSGGSAAVAGQPQITTFQLTGAYEAGDKFAIRLVKSGATKVFGFDGQPSPIAEMALTFKSKMHAAGGKLVHSSSVNAPAKWNRDNTENAGAGFINPASQDEGAQAVTALGQFQGQLAVFAEKVIQTWNIDADPDLNVYLNTVENTGTVARRSVLGYGNNDTFYLDSDGIRSLKARDQTNAPYVSDVGTAIDTLLQEFTGTLTATEIADAVATIEPRDGRFMLAVGNRVFVFSYFPGSKISAWSYYEPGFAVSEFSKAGKKLYARSGNTVYLYGGASGTIYPGDGETPTVVDLPFASAGKPGTAKNFEGFDMAGVNEWSVKLLPDPNDTSVQVNLGSVPALKAITYPIGRLSWTGTLTHVAAQLVCSRAGPRKISNMAFYYEGEAEDG